MAVGGDLSSNRLLEAYRQGIFPWFEDNDPILWWSPDPRLILRPDAFKASKSLQKTLKKPFVFTIDTVFDRVIHACSTSNARTNKTWITPSMIASYKMLHKLGYAHSFEVWYNNDLVGGLYGLSLGLGFFGESMFHHQSDGSKLALYFLCQTLKDWKFDFIDCQLPTPHLASLGAQSITRSEFLKQLKQTLHHPTRIGRWET